MALVSSSVIDSYLSPDAGLERPADRFWDRFADIVKMINAGGARYSELVADGLKFPKWVSEMIPLVESGEISQGEFRAFLVSMAGASLEGGENSKLRVLFIGLTSGIEMDLTFSGDDAAAKLPDMEVKDIVLEGLRSGHMGHSDGFLHFAFTAGEEEEIPLDEIRHALEEGCSQLILRKLWADRGRGYGKVSELNEEMAKMRESGAFKADVIRVMGEK